MEALAARKPSLPCSATSPQPWISPTTVERSFRSAQARSTHCSRLKSAQKPQRQPLPGARRQRRRGARQRAVFSPGSQV